MNRNLHDEKMRMQVLSLVLLQPLACLLGSPQFAPWIEYCHPTAHPSGFIYKLNMFSALDNILWISQGIGQRRKQYYSNQVNKQHMESSCAGIWDLPTLKLSNSCFSKSWRWRAWFSSDIFSLLERICDCTRARVCIQRRVLAAWRLIKLPSTSVFNQGLAGLLMLSLPVIIKEGKSQHTYSINYILLYE